MGVQVVASYDKATNDKPSDKHKLLLLVDGATALRVE